MVHNHGHNGEDRFENLRKNRSKLTLVLCLVLGFAAVEAIGGILSNSLALLSDAGHMVVDAGAIALSLFAVHLSLKPSTSNNTYSLLRMEIVAAFFNGITLMALAGFIFYEAYQRFGEPPEIKGGLMLVVALVGMTINIISAKILWGASHDNLNIKGALLHIMGDLAGSVGAVLAGVIVITSGWTLIDPLISVFIALLIIYSSWGILKDSFHILMEGAPQDINADEVLKEIYGINGVKDVHDFHIWSLTTGMVLLTAHLHIEEEGEGNRILCEVTRLLEEKFGITHSTIQIEDPSIDHCSVSC